MGAGQPAVAIFALTKEEFVDGLHTIMLRQLSFWIGPLLGVATFVVGVFSGEAIAIGWGLVVLAVGAASFWVAPALRWKQSSRLAEEQEHRFSDQGITVRAGKERGQLPWEFYVAVTETPRVYVLARNRRQANFIPKRGFVSPDDESRFRSLAAQHLRTSWLGVTGAANGR